jgi:hypothetical protein
MEGARRRGPQDLSAVSAPDPTPSSNILGPVTYPGVAARLLEPHHACDGPPLPRLLADSSGPRTHRRRGTLLKAPDLVIEIDGGLKWRRSSRSVSKTSDQRGACREMQIWMCCMASTVGRRGKCSTSESPCFSQPDTIGQLSPQL